MRRGILLVVCCAVLPLSAYAQGVLGNLLSGELVNPQNGAWAWYDLKDGASGKAFVVRMAIVDEEKAGPRTGYWLELEIVPLVGYRSVYKMLLTGPAKDPANIKKMIIREGLQEPQELKPDAQEADSAQPGKEPERKLIGQEEVTLPSGQTIKAEHYELSDPAGRTDFWMNSEVRPMGLVKLKSPEGELVLRNNGIGGEDARSVINDPPLMGGTGDDVKVEVKVDKQPKRDKAGVAPKDAESKPKAAVAPPVSEGKKKR